jgi:hypothetical protein
MAPHGGLGTAIGKPDFLGAGDRLRNQFSQSRVELRFAVADDTNRERLLDSFPDSRMIVAEKIRPTPCEEVDVFFAVHIPQT